MGWLRKDKTSEQPSANGSSGTALQQLLDRARGPIGPPVEVDFDQSAGPLVELQQMLSVTNGFFAFNAGVQVFPIHDGEGVPELLWWNSPDSWKYTYGGLADELFCFGQDLLGTQFAIRQNKEVVTFEPETAHITVLGGTLEAWARWLFDDPDTNATESFAYGWQKANGALALNERLVPKQLFVLGGSYDHDNLVVRDAADCMRIRGPIVQQTVGLPEGARVRLSVQPKPTDS